MTSIETRLQQYIDGHCTDAEQREIERLLATDQAWMRAFEAWQELDETLRQELEAEQPSMRFTQNVMEQVQGIRMARPVRRFLNPWVVGALLGVLALMLGWVIWQAVASAQWGTNGGGFTLTLPEWNWSGITAKPVMQVILMVNAVAGLLLADYWMRSRRKRIAHG